MRRKIIQIAGSTCLVSLPKAWIDRYNVKKGDEVDVSEEGPRIIVQPELNRPTEVIKLTIKDAKDFPTRAIFVPFREGYDKLIIEFNDASAMAKIETLVEKLLGFEIVDQKPNSCTIKSFTKVEEHDLEKLLRRIFLLVLNMAKDSAEALEKGQTDKLRAIGDIERTVEKFSQFSMRIINRDQTSKPRKSTFNFATVWTLEQISDNFAAFCNIVSDKDLKLSVPTVRLYKKISQLYQDFYKAFYGRDFENMMQLKIQIRKRKKECFARMKTDDHEAILYLLNILSRINELSYLFI